MYWFSMQGRTTGSHPSQNLPEEGSSPEGPVYHPQQAAPDHTMELPSSLMGLKRILLAGSLAALVALTGCPSDQPLSSGLSAGPPAQATAPTLPAKAAQPDPPQSAAPAPTAQQQAAPAPAPTAVTEANAQRDRALIDSVEKA